MTGTGVDDYVFIGPEGDVNVFRNKYTKDDVPANHYNGPWSAPDKLDTGFSRRALHLGDWDGDNKTDVIGVNRETGALTVWYSRWDGNGFNWKKESIADSAKCSQGWGRLYFDHGAHFADITYVPSLSVASRRAPTCILAFPNMLTFEGALDASITCAWSPTARRPRGFGTTREHGSTRSRSSSVRIGTAQTYVSPMLMVRLADAIP